jgi:hypothetical protein
MSVCGSVEGENAFASQVGVHQNSLEIEKFERSFELGIKNLPL